MAQPLPVGDVVRTVLITRDYAATARAISGYLGIGEWRVRENMETADERFTSAIGGTAHFALELIQPLSGDGPYAAFQQRRGEGMSHLVFQALEGTAPVAAACDALELPYQTREIGGNSQLFIDSRAALCGIALQVSDAPEHDGYGNIAAQTETYPAKALLPVDRLYHIGTVVKDRTAAQQAFSRILGYGNWVEMELHTDQGMSVSLRGQPVDHHARITFARHHNLSCELMDPGAGKGLYHEFLADIGEGMQHFFPTICKPEIFDTALPDLKAAGCAPVLAGEIEGLMVWYYLDTMAQMAGMTIEVICPLTDDWLAAMNFGPEQAAAIGVV